MALPSISQAPEFNRYAYKGGNMKRLLISFVFLSMLSGCATYYDPFDPYMRGMRFFDNMRFDMAKRYWEPLANSGDCDAQYRLGTLYFLGSGVTKNYETAHQWWLAAANRGQAFAQGLLANMYAHDITGINTVAMKMGFDCKKGCGYPKNLVEAYKWSLLAEKFTPYENNRRWHAEKTANYKKSLTEKQIIQVDHAVAKWKPKPDLCQQRRIK